MTLYLIEGVNPEPWTSPAANIMRRGGKLIAHLTSSPLVGAYQAAVASEFRRTYPEVVPYPDGTELQVEFYFWRQMAQYEGDTRINTRNFADATNMQKSTEDALQGVVYGNDRSNVQVSSRIMAAGRHVDPLIVVRVSTDSGPPQWANDTYKQYLERIEDVELPPARDTADWF